VGAYLNEHTDKIVCYPSVWFGPAMIKDLKDLFPPKWLKLNVNPSVVRCMELTLTPDTYSPNMDEHGNYVDYIPVFYNGFSLKCPCGTREHQTYNSRAKFSAHMKSVKHNNWILSVNHNKYNSLFDVINKTSTSMGKRYLKYRILNPINDIHKLNKSYNNIEHFLDKDKNKNISLTVLAILKYFLYERYIYNARLWKSK